MKIEEGILKLGACIKYDSYCCDCYENLDWESHNSGDIDMQCWIAYCKCNNGQRMWTIRAYSFELSSINKQ